MKEMTLKDVQSFSVGIMDHIHDFCVSHDIEYSIAYGTLIGAIRHKGFIPWDDDIDIVMTRPNYEKFCKEYENSEQFILVPTGTDSYLGFARVCEMSKTYVSNKQLPWSKAETGLWVDIFPLDACPEDETAFKSMVDKFYKLWRRSLSIRKGYASFSVKKNILQKGKLLLKKIVYNGIHPISKLTDELREINYESSKYIGNYSFLRYKYKERYLKEDFDHYIDMEFEGHTYKVMCGYDRILRSIYGDYMQLPPKEKRIPIHSFHTNYWK